MNSTQCITWKLDLHILLTLDFITSKTFKLNGGCQIFVAFLSSYFYNFVPTLMDCCRDPALTLWYSLPVGDSGLFVVHESVLFWSTFWPLLELLQKLHDVKIDRWRQYFWTSNGTAASWSISVGTLTDQRAPIFDVLTNLHRNALHHSFYFEGT